jgi:transcriptional regulator with XRE-family HTH domain
MLVARISAMTKLKSLFGRRLRQIRRQHDLTQEQLAELAGISVDMLSNIERGINAPSFETMEKLSKVLSIPVKEFFNIVENPDG